MRALIQRRLAGFRSASDPRERLLSAAAGPVTQTLLEELARPGIHAAVLLGLVERPSGLTMLFTERAPHLKNHPGQISFPGGRLSKGDEGPVAAALREAREEIGLDPRQVAVAGCLDIHLTVTGFSVTPVVGFIGPEFHAAADPAEVAAVFEVPLDYILDPANIRMVYRERLGTRFRTAEMRYEGHRIWGATAAMLLSFRDAICDEKRTG